MKKVTEKREDIAFYIKMYPLVKMHPNAYEKTKSLVCSKSAKFMDDVFSGKEIPKTKCDTKEIDETLKLVETLGITSTPTIILPEGIIIPGYKDADSLIRLIDNKR